MKTWFFLFVAISFFTLNVSARSTLTLSSGVMQAGGLIQLPITIPKEGKTMVGFLFAPSFDYFITKYFSLGIEPSISKNNFVSDSPWSFNLSARGMFYLHLGGAIYPYIGTQAGAGWFSDVSGAVFVLKFPVGILIPLNQWFALNFGVPVELTFTNEGFKHATLPIGYLGASAFF